MPQRILLVDDHPLFRLGLRNLLEREENLTVLHECNSPTEAWDFLQENQIDLIICDLSFQEGSGLSLVRKVREQGWTYPILILSMHEESFWAERVLHEGVNGYIMKDKDIKTVISAANTVLDGKIYLTPQLKENILRRLSIHAKNQTSIANLSNREKDIFQCMAQNMTTKDIAKELYISVKTVQTHQSNIKKKLHLSDLDELRMLASKYSKIENMKHF